MRDQFKVWSEDASSFLEGQTALFDDTTIKHGEILDDLLMENSNNAIACAGAHSSPVQILLYPL